MCRDLGENDPAALLITDTEIVDYCSCDGPEVLVSFEKH